MWRGDLDGRIEGVGASRADYGYFGSALRAAHIVGVMEVIERQGGH